ncbi:tyrosyl-DNA phosphodiesterase 2-like [Physella acuta]|uniref:tyrosyl-DNA phosphodiesterase 2-like n=1 Tax=Physella acuta TaxID=109671 RepID=UPI0027DE4E28|nr:tyrosyl-DNA phosphodiesterase 2-like [Physella acuta]
MDTVEVHSSGVILYPGSRMRRNLLYLKGRVRGVLMTLMTSHLESSAQNYIERGKQLAKVYKEMAEVEPDQTVLFGGDLNVHDWEMGGGTPIPPGVLDLWEVTGRRPETRFTWDLTINDNMQYPEGNQPRKRFDRMYIRHSSTPAVEPLNFRFIGTDRLPSCQRFISDHWGLLASFRVKQHGSACSKS